MRFIERVGFHWVPVILLLVYFITSQNTLVKAFQCYVCDSKEDMECTEKLPHDTTLTARDCRNITGAKFCVKTTNIYAGEFGTKRFCAADDHGNYCKYIKPPNGEREYRSCVLTCDTELCNSSMPVLSLNRQTSYIVSTMVLMSLVIMSKLL